jgi:HAD superfamily hydrolase (TIGR01509 family)
MAQLKALFFDQDGTIVDTEKDGHRIAFNLAFKEFGLPIEWDIDTYYQLLRVAGGKERIRAFLHANGFDRRVAPQEAENSIIALHGRKTEILVKMLAAGQLPLRPGVRRLMLECKERGILVGVCTTSNEKTAQVIVDTLLKDVGIDFILAGDVVSRKKPDPEIYHLALERAGRKAEECFVIEDSQNGVDAACAAGIAVIATTNTYTEQEDLSSADIVITCLGEPQGEKAKLMKGDLHTNFEGVLTLDHLITYLESKQVAK